MERNQQKWAKMGKKGGNGPKWANRGQNGPKWAKPKKTLNIEKKHLKIGKKGKNGQNGPKWNKMGWHVCVFECVWHGADKV